MIRSDCFCSKYRLMTLNMLTKPLIQSINKICSCLNSEACVMAKAAVRGESPIVMVKCPSFSIENNSESTERYLKVENKMLSTISSFFTIVININQEN